MEMQHCDYFDYWGRGTDVTVTSGTTVSPTLFPLVQCASENNNKVTLGCLAQDFSPKSLQFQWAGGTKTPDSVQYIFGENDKYTGVSVVQVLRSDADSLPYNCSITHPGGSKTVQVKLPSPSPPIVTPDRTPNKGEPKVMVHILPEEDIQKISDVSLVCLVSSSTQQDYNIAWSEDAEQGTGNYNDGITSPPQKTNNAYFVTSVYTIKKEKWNQGNYVVTCNVWPAGNNKTITSRGVSKSLDCPQDPKQNYITSEYLSCTDASPEEDEFSSLWSTTSSFIFLFIFTLLYNMIFSLVKMKRQ